MTCERNLPNLIIAGVTKAGTTSLFRYLSRHPQVCSSRVKETCHFLPLRYNEEPRPFSDYLRHFAHCNSGNLIAESTPGYFNGADAVASEINRCLPDVKIILLLRDPVDRFFSHFHYMKFLQKIDHELSAESYLSVCAELTYEDLRSRCNDPWFGLEGGKYSSYLQPWIDNFGPRLFITFFENLKDDPRAYLERLSRFVSIESQYFDCLDFTQENKTRDFRNAWVHAIALKFYGASATFLNRYPTLKKRISSLYGKWNERSVKPDLEEHQHVRSRLEEYYALSNATLRRRLDHLPVEMVEHPLPAWLVDGS